MRTKNEVTLYISPASHHHSSTIIWWHSGGDFCKIAEIL